MGSNDDLSLEKLKINDRLIKVEEHMIEGVETRKVLLSGFSKLETKIDQIDGVVFGNKDKVGILHQVTELSNSAKEIQSVMKRIFWLIASTVLVASLPMVSEFITKVLHK